MLTMVELFGVDVALVEHRRHEVRPPSHYRSGVPEALDRAVLAALEVEPDRRPPTTLAYRQLLRGALPESSFVDAQRLARFVRRVLEQPERSTPERTVVDLGPRAFEPSLTDDVTTRPMRRRPRLRSRLLRLIAAMAGIAALGVAVFFLFAKLI
jgi:hypothetical protein